MHDHWITAEIFQRVKAALSKGRWQVPRTRSSHLDDGVQGSTQARLRRARSRGQRQGSEDRQADSLTFATLADDGSTTTGDWIYVGSYSPKGNLIEAPHGRFTIRRKTIRPEWASIRNWSWSWPLNRRIIYNRASADLQRQSVGSETPRHHMERRKLWVGDVPDYPPTMSPHDPKAWLPFIMNGEGTAGSSPTVCRRSASGTLRADGITGAKRAPSERSKRSRSCTCTTRRPAVRIGSERAPTFRSSRRRTGSRNTSTT